MVSSDAKAVNGIEYKNEITPHKRAETRDEVKREERVKEKRGPHRLVEEVF